MGVKHWFLRSRARKIATVLLLAPIFSCFALYAVLLSAEYLSARRVSRILDRLEEIRLGDPATKFDDAVCGCEIRRTGSEYSCWLGAGAFRLPRLWALVAKLPLEQNYRLARTLDRLGLRFWHLYAYSSVRDNRIQSISAQILVTGKDETLGAKWTIAPEVSKDYLTDESAGDQKRTLIHWFHITSLPSGQGLMVDTTPASNGQEMAARKINRACLFSFRGCLGLCEFVPGAFQILRNRSGESDDWIEAESSKCQKP
jgi:hypothetical protein